MFKEHAAGNEIGFRDTIKQIPSIALLSILFFSYLLLVGGQRQYVALFAVIPALLFTLYNFRILLFTLPILLFGNNHILIFTTTEVYVLLITGSFFLTYANIQWNDFAFPLIKTFLLYLLVLLISTVKSISPLLSLYAINHYLFFLLLICVIYASVKDRDTIMKIIYIYLGCLAVSSLHVIFQGMTTGKRSFGFSGIMYVDYVSLGIVVAAALTIFSKKIYERILFAFLFILYMAGSIMTQTRNTWISTAVVLIVFFTFIGMKREYYAVSRKKFMNLLIICLAVAIIGVVTAVIFNPGALNRITEPEQKNETVISESGMVNSSLLTRLFIWHTAAQAFFSNPVLGIGAYAFPFSSQMYYTIHKKIFTIYVEGKAPHQTFVAVAVETGIAGLIVFTLLYLRLFKFAFRSMVRYTDGDDKRTGLVLGFGLIYCLVSMISTDAWLWGHGIILFGLVAGLLFAHASNTKIAVLNNR